MTFTWRGIPSDLWSALVARAAAERIGIAAIVSRAVRRDLTPECDIWVVMDRHVLVSAHLTAEAASVAAVRVDAATVERVPLDNWLT